jgi:hypothetical protein
LFKLDNVLRILFPFRKCGIHVILKMKFTQIQFPLLGTKGTASDGFGHIIEAEKDVDENEIGSELPKPTDDGKRIAELEAELLETKSRLERVGRPKVVRAFDVPKELFDYDEMNDEIIVTDETGFDNFVDSKCIAQAQGPEES